MTRLTCHVLDVTLGRPAAAMAFELSRDGEPLLDGVTDDGGRSTVSEDLPSGRYQLAFAVGEYFGSGDDAFLDLVPIRFGVAEGTDHLHVALLVTPWSYTTYRGS